MKPKILTIGVCFKNAAGGWTVEGWSFDCAGLPVELSSKGIMGWTFEELALLSATRQEVSDG